MHRRRGEGETGVRATAEIWRMPPEMAALRKAWCSSGVRGRRALAHERSASATERTPRRGRSLIAYRRPPILLDGDDGARAGDAVSAGRSLRNRFATVSALVATLV